MVEGGTADRSVVCKYLCYTYRRRDGTPHVIRLPLVQIYLKSSEMEYHTIALVDTGATATLIPHEFAEALELEYEKESHETIGAGGKFNCKMVTLEKLVLLKNVTPFCTYNNVKVLIPEHEGILPYAVLGRDYVFHRFDITFHERRQKITFTKV